MERLRHSLQQSQKDRDAELRQARMIAETERLALRSEMEVRLEVAAKESQIAVEKRKRLKEEHRARAGEWREKEAALRREIGGLREAVAKTGKAEEVKEELYREIEELRERNGD